MRATGAECLEPGVLSRELKHSTEDLDIGNDNGYDVTYQASNGKQALFDVDLDSGTGQVGNAHVLTICVGNYMVPTKW